MSKNSKSKRDARKRKEAKRERQSRARRLESRESAVDNLRGRRAEYAERWHANATQFENDGHYDWMASFLAGRESVLEIGTGDGHGTIALLRAGHAVVSFDENPSCLNIAGEAVRAAGFDVERISRETVAGGDGLLYGVRYRPFAVSAVVGKAFLIEGDVLNDPELWEWAEAARFDAVACWLMGSHLARGYNEGLRRNHRYSSGGEYRLRVQNKAYELADKVLKPGGILHVVDRGERAVTELLRKDTLNAHRDQASVTTLVVEDALRERPYADPEAGVAMQLTPGLSGRTQSPAETVLFSVTSRKP